MAVTRECEIEVGTIAFRRALIAALPHANKHIVDDHDDENRLRLVVAPKWVFVAATNGDGRSAALAKVAIDVDSRTTAFAPDDGPIQLDLQLRQARLLLQQFKGKSGSNGGDCFLKVNISPGSLMFTDIGGLYSEGETLHVPQDEPAEGFPDVIGILGKALAQAQGDSGPAKKLVTDGQVLKLFAKASQAYQAPITMEGTGTAEQRGFLVMCGRDFIGSVRSGHQDDDSLGKRAQHRLDWLGLLQRPGVAAVAG